MDDRARLVPDRKPKLHRPGFEGRPRPSAKVFSPAPPAPPAVVPRDPWFGLPGQQPLRGDFPVDPSDRAPFFDTGVRGDERAACFAPPYPMAEPVPYSPVTPSVEPVAVSRPRSGFQTVAERMRVINALQSSCSHDPRVQRFIDGCQGRYPGQPPIIEAIKDLSINKAKRGHWIWALVPQPPLGFSDLSRFFAFQPGEADIYFRDPYLRQAYSMVVSGLADVWAGAGNITDTDGLKIKASLAEARSVLIRAGSESWINEPVYDWNGNRVTFQALIQEVSRKVA